MDVVIVGAVLYGMAVTDVVFAGIREAGGRVALIDKRRFYYRQIARSLVVGHIAIALSAAALFLPFTWTKDPAQLLADYGTAGNRLLQIYLPYTGVMALAFAVRLIPSVDIRSTLSVVIFGPMTLIRPAVAAVGVIWAMIAVPRIEVVLSGALVLIFMLSIDIVLGKVRVRAMGRTAHIA